MHSRWRKQIKILISVKETIQFHIIFFKIYLFGIKMTGPSDCLGVYHIIIYKARYFKSTVIYQMVVFFELYLIVSSVNPPRLNGYITVIPATATNVSFDVLCWCVTMAICPLTTHAMCYTHAVHTIAQGQPQGQPPSLGVSCVIVICDSSILDVR